MRASACRTAAKTVATTQPKSPRSVHSSVSVPRRLRVSANRFPRLTHYLFRFPAKFHPPVIQRIIETYSKTGDTILDPFCGSGSLLVEAAIAGRHSIGVDVDPLAVFVSRMKTARLDCNRLSSSVTDLQASISCWRRPVSEYEYRKFVDIDDTDFDSTIGNSTLWIPRIPNLFHWFRRYVIVDLARVINEIVTIDVPSIHRDFMLLVFASIIRTVSNADPVPISGLEVTSHMRQKDAKGRLIDPFGVFNKAITRALEDVASYQSALPAYSKTRVINGDAMTLSEHITEGVDLVVTSPPYQNAVDYYRRHTLEMYWLRLVETHEERLVLRPKYIGGPNVRRRDALSCWLTDRSSLVRDWDAVIRKESANRAAQFRHYVAAMSGVLRELSVVLSAGAKAVVIVGHSQWRGMEIPLSDLLVEIAEEWFELSEFFSYPIRNRYMSYDRKNGADISQEYVIVFQRRHDGRRLAVQ